MIVVDQPFGRRRDCAALAKCFDEGFVSGFEFAAVVFEPRQQLCAAFSVTVLCCSGKSLRKLLQTFDTEELCLKRLFVSIAVGLRTNEASDSNNSLMNVCSQGNS